MIWSTIPLLTVMNEQTIQLGHGGGGLLSRDLIQREIVLRFGGGALKGLPDGATLPVPSGRFLVFTTDSFVVRPLEFPGGNIGDLAVHGTVNDLAVCGAIPRWLSLALILEEGLPLATLRRVLDSVKRAADECGVAVVTGDTKVVERGQCDGMYVNTAGIGERLGGFELDPGRVVPGDHVLVSGPVGDHGMAVLAAREGIRITHGVDCAMGITWEQPADHSTNFLVRVSGLDAYGLVIPVSGLKGVFTADGKLVRHVLVTRNKDEVDLWFCGTPDPVVYLGWRNADLAPGVTFHSLKSVVPALPGDAHPAGFAADVPVVTGVPGRIFRHPNWRIVDGAVRQTSSGANVYLATTPQFREGTVSLRVKPLTAQYAGFMVRGADRDSPDLNSIYWLIQSSSKTNEEGYCQVWGALTDSRPGPMLLKDQWNTLKAVLHGDTVELIINGQTAKTLSLPPTVANTGSLVLATYGGSADFDDVHVTAPDGHELFTDAFETPVIDDRRWWVTPDGRASGGFARIVNEGTNRANCLFSLSFHRAPWTKRYAMTLSSGEASRWMWLPAWVRSVPFSINASAPNAPIRIELATDMDPGAIFRKVTVPAAQRTEGFESRTLEFSNAGHVPTLSEVSGETLRAVTAMSFKGRVPERFPIGYPGGHYFDYEACRVLGFNMALLTPNTVNPDIFDKLGYKYIVTYTHLLTAIGKGVGYRQSINTNEMRLLAEHWTDTGLHWYLV